MGPGLSVRAEGARELSFLPRTLFGRTAAALLAAFLVFETLAFAVVWLTLIRPMAERSADDLAAKISLAAKTWVELPPQTRTDYEMELAFRHDLELGAATKPLADAAPSTWFGDLLAASLGRRLQQPVRLKRGPDDNWVWLDLKVADKQCGSVSARIAMRCRRRWRRSASSCWALPDRVTALLMVGRVGRRLNSLAEKAAEVGQGRDPEPLPETGPQEIRELTAAFNRMAGEVHALLENRTVLLSGISHDLRTPITRLKLALSMLDAADAVQVKRMERDLDEMNRLIGDMLVFARALQANDRKDCDLAATLDDLVETAARLGPLHWQPPAAACVANVGEAALRRIVGNLLDNARRYGAKRWSIWNCCAARPRCVLRCWIAGPGFPRISARRCSAVPSSRRLPQPRQRRQRPRAGDCAATRGRLWLAYRIPAARRGGLDAS